MPTKPIHVYQIGLFKGHNIATVHLEGKPEKMNCWRVRNSWRASTFPTFAIGIEQKFQGWRKTERTCKENRFRRITGERESKCRNSHVHTLRLGPWHPEGQPTCSAKPLGIEATPSMINSAATYNKCCTVYVTYFKIEETQHSCFSCSPLKRSYGPNTSKVPVGTTTLNPIPIVFHYLFLLAQF